MISLPFQKLPRSDRSSLPLVHRKTGRPFCCQYTKTLQTFWGGHDYRRCTHNAMDRESETYIKCVFVHSLISTTTPDDSGQFLMSSKTWDDSHDSGQLRTILDDSDDSDGASDSMSLQSESKSTLPEPERNRGCDPEYSSLLLTRTIHTLTHLRAPPIMELSNRYPFAQTIPPLPLSPAHKKAFRAHTHVGHLTAALSPDAWFFPTPKSSRFARCR